MCIAASIGSATQLILEPDKSLPWPVRINLGSNRHSRGIGRGNEDGVAKESHSGYKQPRGSQDMSHWYSRKDLRKDKEKGGFFCYIRRLSCNPASNPYR